MLLVADGVRVVPGGGDEEEQGLHPRVAGSLGHDVEQLPVRLRVQLVEDDAVRVEPVLVRDIRGQHLVEAMRRQVFEPLLRFEDLHALGESRAEAHHVDRDVEHDLGLVPVGGAAVHLGPLLVVPAGQKQRDRRGKLALSLLLRDLHVGGVELPVAVLLDHAEEIPDDLLLPVDELERLPGPRALGVAELLDEEHRVVRERLVVV